MTGKNRRGRPALDITADQEEAIYDFGSRALSVFRLMKVEDWADLISARTSSDVVNVLQRVAFGYKIMGGRAYDDPRSLPSLMRAAVRERDFPKVNIEKQMTFIAFSIAAEGEMGGIVEIGLRRSRAICGSLHKQKINGRH